MSRRKIKAGSTSVMVPIFVQDTSSTTGGGLGSLVFNTSGLAAKYRRAGDATWTTIALVTATVGTFTDSGFKADGGPVTGGYEVGIPDAALASGARWAEVVYYGATNMLPVLLEFELDTLDYQASGGKFPATLAAADVSGSLPTADSSGTTTLLSRVTAAVGSPQQSGSPVTLPANPPAGFIDAASIAAGALNGKGDWATASAQTAMQTSINNLNNLSALANLFAPSTLVRPSSGSIAYPFTFVVKDGEGHLVDVDTNAVTLTATNAAGVDRSANLSVVTHAGTGEYTFTYTVATAHADEGLRITAAGTVQSATRKAYANCDVADADSLSALAAIQAQTDKLAFDGSSNVKSTPQTDVTVDAGSVTAIQSGLATSTVVQAIKTVTDQLAFDGDGNLEVVLVSSGLDAVLVESGISASASLVNDTGTQLTSINARQALALFAAVLDGILAGGGGTTITIKPAAKGGSSSRVTATVDANGNRSALVLRVPD